MLNKKTIQFFSLLLLLALACDSVFAQTGGTSGVNIQSMFANFKSSGDSLIRLTQVAAYMIGVFLVMGSVFKFAQVGQGQVTIRSPIIMFFAGIALIALTGTLAVLTQTMSMGSGPGNILMPSGGGLAASKAQAIMGVLTFIRLIGYIAFIRGWLLINQYGAASQPQPGLLSKALIHMVGGVAAINVQITAKILANTFAPGMPIPFI